MKTITFFLTVALLSISSSIFSQSVKYEITKDDANDHHSLYLTPIVGMDFWEGESMLVGYGLVGKYFVTNRIVIDGYFNKGVNIGDIFHEEILPFGWEIGGQFAFSSKLKNKALKIKVAEVGNTKYTLTVKGEQIRNWAFRGAFMNHYSMGTNKRLVTMTGIAFGIGHLSWSNLQANIEGYGIKYGSEMSGFYFDLIYATSININNDPSEYYYTYDASSKLGYRIGYQIYKNVSRTISLYMKMEIGNRPGIKTDSSVPDFGFLAGFAIQLL